MVTQCSRVWTHNHNDGLNTLLPIGCNPVKKVTQCSRVSTQNYINGINTFLPNITSDVWWCIARI